MYTTYSLFGVCELSVTMIPKVVFESYDCFPSLIGHQERDGYGNEVTQIARPLPVEYLLVDLPAAFPVEPQTTFSIISEKAFPVENRADIGDLQVSS